MRILHVLNHTGRLNGHVHAAVDLACAQAALGHDVAICSGGGSFDGLLAVNGVETFAVPQKRTPAGIAATVLSLRSLIKTWGADLVHAHMAASALVAWPACTLTRVPLVTTVHNAFERSAVLMGVGNRVIAVSAAVGRSMAKRGIAASRLRVVLNGTVGSARFADAGVVPAPLERPAVVFVGGLHPRKGVEDLLRAFAQVRRTVPDPHLYLVGEGPHAQAYEALVRDLGIGGVTFCGGQNDVRPYLASADLFVLPSHADPAPLVVSEAREAGCAIIGTRVDGIPELLDDGEAGVLVPPRDPDALATAMVTLLQDRRALADWRRRSRVNIEHMSIARVARDTLAVYGECRRAAPQTGTAAVLR